MDDFQTFSLICSCKMESHEQPKNEWLIEMFLKIANNKSGNLKLYLNHGNQDSQSLETNKKQKEIRDSLTSFSKALCPCTIKTHGLFLVDCRPSSLLSLHGICLLPIKEDKINIG